MSKKDTTSHQTQLCESWLAENFSHKQLHQICCIPTFSVPRVCTYLYACYMWKKIGKCVKQNSYCIWIKQEHSKKKQHPLNIVWRITYYYKKEKVSICKVIKVLQKWCKYCIRWNHICESKLLFHSSYFFFWDLYKTRLYFHCWHFNCYFPLRFSVVW